MAATKPTTPQRTARTRQVQTRDLGLRAEGNSGRAKLDPDRSGTLLVIDDDTVARCFVCLVRKTAAAGQTDKHTDNHRQKQKIFHIREFNSTMSHNKTAVK